MEIDLHFCWKRNYITSDHTIKKIKTIPKKHIVYFIFKWDYWKNPSRNYLCDYLGNKIHTIFIIIGSFQK